jgi:hypothetical protein
MGNRRSWIVQAVILFLVGGVFPAARAEEPPIVAVFDMEDRGSGLGRASLDNLTDYLAALLAEGGHQVIPRSQIKERLKEQRKESYRQCFDQSCQVEMGRELAAQKSLSTQLMKIGSVCRVTASLYDLKKAATEKAATAGANCTENELLLAVEEVGRKLLGKQVAEADPGAAAEAPPAGIDREIEERERTEKAQRAIREWKAQAQQETKKKTLSDHGWNVDAKLAVLMPSLGEGEGLEVEGSPETEIGAGVLVDFDADLRLGSFLSLGAFLSFFSTEGTTVGGTSSSGLSYVAAGGKLKGIFSMGENAEWRIGFILGYGGFVGDSHVGAGTGGPMDVAGSKGIATGLSLEFVYYLSDGFGLVGDFGFLGQTEGTFSDSGNEKDITFNPLLYLAVGIEFGG